MNIPKTELKIETMRGTGPGGQHKNKTDSACRITHIPTGISSYADERKQTQSKKKAMAELIKRIKQAKADKVAANKKARRDHAIANQKTIRTYDFKKNRVKNHVTGKTADLKRVLVKGEIDLIR